MIPIFKCSNITPTCPFTTLVCVKVSIKPIEITYQAKRPGLKTTIYGKKFSCLRYKKGNACAKLLAFIEEELKMMRSPHLFIKLIIANSMIPSTLLVVLMAIKILEPKFEG